MFSEPEAAGRQEDPRSVTWFQAGQSGNPTGRPKGSRNKLSEDFVGALYQDFQAHGVQAIADTREKDPATYVRVIAGLLPKEMKITTERDLTDEQLDARIQQLAKALNLEIKPIVTIEHDRDEPPR